MTEPRADLESIDQPSVHHEESDVNVGAIFGFAAGLFVTAIVVSVVVWLMFAYFDRRETQRSGAASPLATTEVRQPPEPRLQIAPREDAARFRAEEDALLNGYTWIDRSAGTVRIPIEEAKKLTLQKGLPVRESAQVAQQ
jgi:hypothetical protein